MSEALVETDVLVLGGGPAGSLASVQTARLGLRTMLIHRRDQRRDIFETLAPKAAGLLVEQGAQRVLADALVDRAVRTSLRWSEPHVQEISTSDKPALLINRARLDNGLRALARLSGVATIETAKPARVTEGDAGWACTVAGNDGPTLRARFLIDARGRRASDMQRTTGVSSAALGCTWQSRPRHAANMYVDAVRDGWIWGISLANGVRAVEVLLDSERCAGVKRAGRAALVQQMLAQSVLFGAWLDLGTPTRLSVRDATPRAATTPMTATCLKVGDASLAMDPLSGQGLSYAFRTAVQAGPLVNTVLHRGDHELATAFCNGQQQRSRRAAFDHAARLYGEQALFPNSSFWQRRRLPHQHTRKAQIRHNATRYRLARETEIREAPALVGAYIERRPAVYHPNLTYPAVWVHDTSLAEFVARLRDGHCAADRLTDAATHSRLLRWCVENGVLEAC